MSLKPKLITLVALILTAILAGTASAHVPPGKARRLCIANGGTWVNHAPFRTGCYYRFGSFTIPETGLRYPAH